jgi:hypothetical protein
MLPFQVFISISGRHPISQFICEAATYFLVVLYCVRCILYDLSLDMYSIRTRSYIGMWRAEQCEENSLTLYECLEIKRKTSTCIFVNNL